MPNWADPNYPFDSRPHNPAWYYPGTGTTPVTPAAPVSTMPVPSALKLTLYPPSVAVLTWNFSSDDPNIEMHVLRADVIQTSMGGMPGVFVLADVLPTFVHSWATNSAKLGGVGTDAELYRVYAVNRVTGETTHQLEPYEQVGTHTSGQLGV